MLVAESDKLLVQAVLQQVEDEKLLHQFNGLFSRTTWLSQYQKGRTILN